MEVETKVAPGALARLEEAREKARIMEKELVAVLSELEQAAEKRKREMERWKQNPG